MAGPIVLRRVKRRTVVDEVMAEIRGLIAAGELRKGDKLPPEYELAGALGVGRSSVREALKGLVAAGVIERTQEGTFVSTSDESLAEPLRYRAMLEGVTLMELCEARRVLETEFAEMAAVRSTDEDIAVIREAVERMTSAVDVDVAEFIDADVRFHLAVAKASRNRILCELFAAVRALLTEAQERVVSNSPGIQRRSLEFHNRIRSRIEERNPEAARAEMMQHLQDVEKGFNNTFSENELVNWHKT